MNTCIICLDEEEDIDKLFVYDHCGVYHIHKDCLKRWKKNECIICREKIKIENHEENNTCRLCLALSLLSASIVGMLYTLLILI